MGDVERDLGRDLGVAVSTDGRSAALRAEPLAASQAEPAATNAADLVARLRDHPEPQEGFWPLYVDTMREAADEIERLYGLAKANNALARMNARRAENAEYKLAEQEGRMEWLSDLLDEARAQKETMYLAKQEAQFALASAMSASGQDPQGLEAKPASAVGAAETPKDTPPHDQ